ncbi:S1C family serine protease [Saliterribacillus persicus]|uniref:Trypsin-like peptidase n=1 Tax=Saliterribacillus persicus TaxID=930114 RepID=A0A368XUV5_9BACI|nr:S1C family serine protease [Saliterribacillus persicus]RCW71850.1 trypsin-like peptidase [Saliterribacillus persicus]
MLKKHTHIPIGLSILLFISGIILTVLLYNNWTSEALHQTNSLASVASDENSPLDLKSIIDRSQNSVVQIETSNSMTEKTGAGFLYNNKGDIVTNAHVLEDAEQIFVTLHNSRSFPAAIVGIGKDHDVAVIRVPQLAEEQPISIENEIFADIGDEVIAIGSPTGIQNAVSIGLVVGTDRNFSINDYSYTDVYQISANITHGNSGGPLIDRESGKVIAINAAGISDSDVGFSIPMPSVKKQIDTWIEEVDESELVYLTPIDQQLNEDQIIEDATNLVEVFFQNIAAREYINAYTLLGSSEQEDLRYQDFRDDFIHVSDMEISNISSEYSNGEVEIKVIVDVTLRNDATNEINENWNYQLIVASENDQLKILNYDD